MAGMLDNTPLLLQRVRIQITALLNDGTCVAVDDSEYPGILEEEDARIIAILQEVSGLPVAPLEILVASTLLRDLSAPDREKRRTELFLAQLEAKLRTGRSETQEEPPFKPALDSDPPPKGSV